MNIVTRYRNLPVKHKLRLIIIFTASVALVLACGAIVAYDQTLTRDGMRSDMAVSAEIAGSSSSHE